MREEVINTCLARILLDDHHMRAIPEQGNRRRQVPDLRIFPFEGGLRPVICEAKIGTQESKRRSAENQVRKRLQRAGPRTEALGLAVCYPLGINREGTPQDVEGRLKEAKDIHWLIVESEDDGRGYWRKTPLRDMAEALRSETGRGGSILGILEWLIDYGCTQWRDNQLNAARKGLSLALSLPANEGKDKPLRIGCLIILNACLLHARLYARTSKRGVASIDECATSESVQLSLADAWRQILELDYAPVFEPALAAVEALPSGQDCEDILHKMAWQAGSLKEKIDAVSFDHAGPLYHKLLKSARYDGSYYTTAPAAMLLARLALDRIECDWRNPDEIESLRVLDPACGTGTLLMAVLHAIRDIHIAEAGKDADWDYVHLSLVQHVLCGMDINRHGVHLTACNLTMGTPNVDYNRMPLYTMLHGVHNGKALAGSLEVLAPERNGLLAPIIQNPNSAMRARLDERVQAEDEHDFLQDDLRQPRDLVIMNPPFTRNDIRNRQLPKKNRRLVQKREVTIAQGLTMEHKAAGEAIDQSSIRTFFTPIADRVLKEQGAVLALIAPTTAMSAPSGKKERAFLAARFQIDWVITSHDPDRVFFSENTNINESLVIAKRAGDSPRPTRFLQLHRNPKTPSEALALASAVRTGEGLDRFGKRMECAYAKMMEGDWSDALFHNPKLVDARDELHALAGHTLLPLRQMARVEPDGRRTRDAFRSPKKNKRKNRDQNGRYPILWYHKTELRRTMQAMPDARMDPKPKKAEYAASNLWPKASRLLLGNKLRLPLVHTAAVWLEEPALGSAWSPITPRPCYADGTNIQKAWCAWLNSTLGALLLLEQRTKTLIYPAFPLDGLRALLCPNPNVADLAPLVEAFDATKNAVLGPWPKMHQCPVRRRLDEAAARVARINGEKLARWRSMLTSEPSVCARRPD